MVMDITTKFSLQAELPCPFKHFTNSRFPVRYVQTDPAVRIYAIKFNNTRKVSQ
jgi:hypothetical protein